jgi:hypothetical protein
VTDLTNPGRPNGTARTTSFVVRMALLALVPMLFGDPAHAQLVTGQVLEGATSASVPSPAVRLLDAEGGWASTTAGDGAGRFTLQAPGPGRYRVEVGRAGYVAGLSEWFEVAEGSVVALPPLRIDLDPEAIENLPVPGRTVVGRVTAEGFDDPLASVLVRALDASGEGVAAAMTDPAGRFRLDLPEVGVFTIEASRIGHETRMRESVEVGDESGARIALSLPWESIQPGREYYHNQTNLTRGSHQFNRRREQGLGFFFSREDITALEPERLINVFEEVPGLLVRPWENSIISTIGWQCLVFVYNHAGRPMAFSYRNLSTLLLRPSGLHNLGRPPRGASGYSPRDLFEIEVDEVEGIEVYRSFREVPDEIRASIYMSWIWPPEHLGGCGVVVVWTRLGW